jgi:hypothetical protein
MDLWRLLQGESLQTPSNAGVAGTFLGWCTERACGGGGKGDGSPQRILPAPSVDYLADYGANRSRQRIDTNKSSNERFMKRIVSGLMIVIWMITLVTGCDQKTTETKESGSVEKSIDVDANYTTQLEGKMLVTVLSANLLVPDVATFLDTLANWGYSYRQSNSYVLVQNHYRRTAGPADDVSEKVVPDHSYTELVSSDTLM